MAIMKCPECGKEISDKASKCVHCGYPLKRMKDKMVCPECGKEVSRKDSKCMHCGYPLKKGKYTVVTICGVAAVIITIAVILIMNIAKPICEFTGCNNKSYENGYCLFHILENAQGDNTSAHDDADNGKTIAEDEEQIRTFKKDNRVTGKSSEFKFIGYTIAARIEPNVDENSLYHYYKANDGNYYFDAKFEIKNLLHDKVKQDSVLSSVKIIYDGKYEYDCFAVTVDKDGDFEGFTSLYGINPLETLEYHMLVQVPTEVKNSGKSIKLRVALDGIIYECKIR